MLPFRRFLRKFKNWFQRPSADEVARIIQEKETLYRLLIETLPQGVFLKDSQSRYLSANQQYIQLFKTSGGDIAGLRDDELMDSQTAGRFLEADRQVLQTGETLEYEECLQDEGAFRWFRNVKKLVKTPSGRVLGVLGIVEDISDRKKAELAVRQSEVLFRSTFTQATVGMGFCDRSGLLLEVNQKFCSIAGLDEKTLVGHRKIQQLFPSSHGSDEHQFWAELFAENKTGYSGERSYQHGDGSEAWVTLSLSRIDVGTGERRYLIVAEDVSDRKRAEKFLDANRTGLENLVAQRTSELQLSEEKARALFKAVPVPTFTWQLTGQDFVLMDFNDAAYGFTRGKVLDMLGKKQDELFPQMRLEDRLTFVLRSKSILSEIVDYPVGGDAEVKTLSVKYAYVPPDLVILHMEDISALKKAEIAQIEARRQAEEAARSKSEFLANMSHEIRTPMNAVLGLSHLLMSTSLDDQQKEYTNHLQNSARLLLGILNDILDFSKIEAGRLQIETIRFSPMKSLLSTFEIGRLQAEEKGLAFEVVMDPALPRELMGDPLRLDQIVINLVNNAVKFTEKGWIKVRVSLVNTDKFSIQVEDSGVGISPEQLKTLFRPFTQADGSTTRRFGGTGLGLVITRSLAEMMNGKIEVQSQVGQGTVFTVTLPMKVPREQPAAEPPQGDWGEGPVSPTSFMGKRILLVEDNPINQLVAKEILKKREVAVESAMNGQVAVDILRRDSRFDAVLMDIQMPVLDGYAAAEMIRRELRLDQLPMIAMTAHATEEDRQRCLASGMNDYLSKPVVPDKLWEILGRWIG